MAKRQLKYERPNLTSYQTAFVDDPSPVTVVEASTKVGKTEACMVWIEEQAFAGENGQDFWWLAPVYGQAAIAFRRMKLALPQSIYSANEAEMRITFINGASIWFKSADKPDNLYGNDVWGCVIDEATRCPSPAWDAVQSVTTATHGRIKIIGNVVGKKNWAYDLARRAENQTIPDTSYHRITVWDAIDAGILDREWVEKRRNWLLPHIFKQLFECIPADDGGNPFDWTAIDGCVRPMSDGEPVAWGWDLARAQDWTVGVALDRHGHVCRFERWQAPWLATKSNILAITRDVPALVDSTGVGDPILEFLQSESRGNFTGYHFTQPSKQRLMERLATSIQQAEVGFPADDLPRRPLIRELKSFEYQLIPTGVHYSAPRGYHDDCVVALSLALWHWRNVAEDGSDLLVTSSFGGEPDDSSIEWTRIA